MCPHNRDISHYFYQLKHGSLMHSRKSWVFTCFTLERSGATTRPIIIMGVYALMINPGVRPTNAGVF